MEEITRYQQIRAIQQISEEEKKVIGLPLYPTKKLSDLAVKLKNAFNDPGIYDTILSRYKEEKQSFNIIKDLNKVNPLISSLYTWLDFKAKPIRNDDLIAFVRHTKFDNLTDPLLEWSHYADNLLLAILDKSSLQNFCIDFQLLIKTCYIVKLCLDVKNNKVDVKSSSNTDLINQILFQPILLPEAIIRSRCNDDCLKNNKMQIPAVPAFTEKVGKVIPPCECNENKDCLPPSSACICIKPYVADLFIVKEELARFEAGDIADIENILAGELKVRRHRTLLKSEDTAETETNTDTSEERDHQVNEKFSLQSEVKNATDSKNNLDMGVTSTFKYGDSVTISPHVNYNSSTSKSDSNSAAHSYAKELLDRSVTKIQEKVRKLQITKIINELEEKNKHSIDNTLTGAKHRAGLYYWVNKVTHAQVFNYGKHMMFDLIVPEPAAIFKKLYQIKKDKNIGDEKPSKPTYRPEQITRNNYGEILNQFAIATSDEIQPPNARTSVQFAFSQSVSHSDKNSPVGFATHDIKSPQIPVGYKAVSMNYDVRSSTGHALGTPDLDEVAISVNVGEICIFNHTLNEFRPTEPTPIPNKDWIATATDVPMNNEEGIITLAIAGFTSLCFSLSGTVCINCELTPEAIAKWQMQIFNLIMADYQRKLDAYNAIHNDGSVQIKGRNPFLNREIERNEFKRNIIAILLCNYFNGLGSVMERVYPCGYPEVDFNKLEKDAPLIQFFEQVFEWEYLTYLFYHSMWARKSKWPELIDEDSGDPLFDKFLMAGAARIQVPIKPGMEESFNWYLKYGQIWEGKGQMPVSSDADYVSLIQEIKQSKNCDYTDRPGLVDATKGDNVVQLHDSSTFYWDIINNKQNTSNIENDIDRELLLDYKLYRIVKIEQDTPADIATWNITIDKPYEGDNAKNLKHAVGALYVGAPWEIVIPTKLVYLKNIDDKLPVYPLT